MSAFEKKGGEFYWILFKQTQVAQIMRWLTNMEHGSFILTHFKKVWLD